MNNGKCELKNVALWGAWTIDQASISKPDSSLLFLHTTFVLFQVADFLKFSSSRSAVHNSSQSLKQHSSSSLGEHVKHKKLTSHAVSWP